MTAVDGKTIRGSKSQNQRARHVLFAFVADYEVTMGEVIVDAKSNEITADAMICQKDIVAKIL